MTTRARKVALEELYQKSLRALLHKISAEGKAPTLRVADAQALEKARQQSAAGGTLVILQHPDSRAHHESFSNELGDWNVTLLNNFIAEHPDWFGPYEMPFDHVFLQYLRKYYDIDKRFDVREGYTPPEGELERPVVFHLSRDGLTLIDGTHRAVNRLEQGARKLRCWVVPDVIADAFRTYYFRDGKEVDYKALTKAGFGTYANRAADGSFAIEGVDPSIIKALNKGKT